MRSLLRSSLLLPAYLAFAATASAAALAVPLAVEEPAGIARHGFPATAGIPFPRGRVTRVDALWLAGPGGQPALAQLRPLERWPDGSVRWLLVDFLADVAAGGRATYTLSDGGPRAPRGGSRVRLERRGGRHVLDTGPLRLAVDDTGATLLAEVAAGARRLPGAVALPAVVLGDASGGAPLPEAVRVETEGPVRTELLLRSRTPEGIAHEIRLAVFAGQPAVRVQHTLTNVGDPHYAMIRSVSVGVPGRFQTAQIGVDHGVRTVSLDRAHTFRQTDESTLLLDGEAIARHGSGWLRATGAEIAVTLASRYFSQEYPQAFVAAPTGLRLDVFATDSGGIPFGSGAAKTHEWWLFVEPAAGAHAPDQVAAAWAAPLVALPAPEWIVASRAVPQALAPGASGARDFLGRLATATSHYLAAARTARWDEGPAGPCAQRTRENPRTGFFGALNWGDWNFPGYRDPAEEGCDAWGNLEYDLPQVFGLAYLATGSRLFFDALVPAVRHYRDVDVVHHWADHPEWVGMNHPHKPMHFAFESVHEVDLGHTWLEGLLTHYRITGEIRSLEAARAIADVLSNSVDKAGNPRQLGWPMIALVAAADATGEGRYLDAARRYADRALHAVAPTPASGDWKMGILADGLASVHAATGELRYRQWLEAYAAALAGAPERWPDARFALPLGYLAGLSGERRQAASALGVAHRMPIGEWGKPLAIAGRVGFRLLAPLQSLPVTARGR